MRGAQIGKPADTSLKNVQTLTGRKKVDKEAGPINSGLPKPVFLGPRMLQIDAPRKQARHKDGIKNHNIVFLVGPRTNDRKKQDATALEHGKGPCERSKNRQTASYILKNYSFVHKHKKGRKQHSIGMSKSPQGPPKQPLGLHGSGHNRSLAE